MYSQSICKKCENLHHAKISHYTGYAELAFELIMSLFVHVSLHSTCTMYWICTCTCRYQRMTKLDVLLSHHFFWVPALEHRSKGFSLLMRLGGYCFTLRVPTDCGYGVFKHITSHWKCQNKTQVMILQMKVWIKDCTAWSHTWTKTHKTLLQSQHCKGLYWSHTWTKTDKTLLLCQHCKRLYWSHTWTKTDKTLLQCQQEHN